MKKTNPQRMRAIEKTTELRTPAIENAHNAVPRNQMPAGPRGPYHFAAGIEATAFAL